LQGCLNNKELNNAVSSMAFYEQNDKHNQGSTFLFMFYQQYKSMITSLD